MRETDKGVLRGLQRQMVVVATKDSRYYEEAYFILRESVTCGTDAAESMLEEANRILSASMVFPERRHKRPGAGWIFFGGFLCGMGLASTILLLLLR